MALPGQLAVDRVKHGLAGPGLDQTFLERPDDGAIGTLAVVAKTDKALQAEAVKQLELHLRIAQGKQLLDQQHTHHQFSGEWRTTAAVGTGAWRGMIDPGGQCLEVDMLLQYPQRVARSLSFVPRSWPANSLCLIIGIR